MRRDRILTLALALLAATAAHADRRITDIDGQEMRIARGAKVLTRVAANKRTTGGMIVVNAGADTDAANNDFRRIQNAINAAIAGDVIRLNGTFDFSAPFAAAAWAVGSDNLVGTADDYSVLVPAGRNNITVTAATLGDATIQGPGDLAAINLEGFLVFDGGDNQNWTISNLRILDFDLAIGMFNGAGGSDAFSGTEISDNFIRIATDLNATVAPADVNQNIGLHYSFGAAQSIVRNTFHVAGDGVSNGANTSASVGMQSNVSGGNVYNGLNISDNVLHVLNAHSANPQTVLGFWENGHAHTSNITVSGNDFINDAPGNDPFQNLQRAFRVTSHASPTSSVVYRANHVVGANIGLQWLTGFNFAGNLAVQLDGNLLEQCSTGVLVQSSGLAYLIDNTILDSDGVGVRITTGALAPLGPMGSGMFRNTISGGTTDGVVFDATAQISSTLTENDFSGNAGFGVRNDAAPLLTAEYNWWGSNEAVEVATEVGPNIDYDPWRSTQHDLFGNGFE